MAAGEIGLEICSLVDGRSAETEDFLGETAPQLGINPPNPPRLTSEAFNNYLIVRYPPFIKDLYLIFYSARIIIRYDISAMTHRGGKRLSSSLGRSSACENASTAIIRYARAEPLYMLSLPDFSRTRYTLPLMR
jgi:hypothetical protein